VGLVTKSRKEHKRKETTTTYKHRTKQRGELKKTHLSHPESYTQYRINMKYLLGVSTTTSQNTQSRMMRKTFYTSRQNEKLKRKRQP
jgi:hypothetical protein